MTDNVNHPNHYTQGGVECIDAIAAATTGKTSIEAVCVANVIKYLWRYELKNGLEDVKKARWYLDRLISEMPEPAPQKAPQPPVHVSFPCDINGPHSPVQKGPESAPVCDHRFGLTLQDAVSRCVRCGLREDES